MKFPDAVPFCGWKTESPTCILYQPVERTDNMLPKEVKAARLLAFQKVFAAVL